MRAGKFDRRVRIELSTLVDDGYGETREWTTHVETACQFIPSAGKEARELLGREATAPATFIVRHWDQTAPLLTDTASYRLRFPAKDDGRVYDIKSATNPDRRETIHITAVAGSP